MKKKYLLVLLTLAFSVFQGHAQDLKGQHISAAASAQAIEHSARDDDEALSCKELQKVVDQLRVDLEELKNNDTHRLTLQLENLILKNCWNEQKLSVETNLPSSTNYAELIIADCFGRIMYQKSVGNRELKKFNYANWGPGKYCVELYIDDELSERTLVAIKN